MSPNPLPQPRPPQPARYAVQKVVVLRSPSAVRAILRLANHCRAVVVQNDAVTLLDDDELADTIPLTSKPPYAVVANTLAALSSDSRLTFVTVAEGHAKLHARPATFAERVDLLCDGAEQFFATCGCALYRHQPLDERHALVRKFRTPIKALSVSEHAVLVMLSTHLYGVDVETGDAHLQISCDIANPIDIFWSASTPVLLWFLAVVRPHATDENRTHKLLMAEMAEKRMTVRDVSPDDVPLERTLKCAIRANKLLTLADNGNVVLIHQVDNFEKLDLLYRGEATDSAFTAGEFLRVSISASAPRIALGTSNGAIAFLDEV